MEAPASSQTLRQRGGFASRAMDAGTNSWKPSRRPQPIDVAYAMDSLRCQNAIVAKMTSASLQRKVLGQCRRAARDGLQRLLGSFGYVVYRRPTRDIEFDARFLKMYRTCAPFTGTSVERMYALYQAVGYVVARGIPGSFVECGVWRGGSSMLAAMTLLESGNRNRDLYLYDTFAGMSAPSDKDVTVSGEKAGTIWRPRLGAGWGADGTSLDEVKESLYSTGYPRDQITFVKGKVEDTLPGTAPPKIAILRLDTDWYESTYHELCHLFPLVSPGGVLIIDDYGYWLGARDAVDQYLSEQHVDMLLNRIDLTGRMGIRT